MDTLRDFFEEEQRHHREEAAGMPPLGMRVTELIAKQEADGKKTHRIWWLTGGAGFLLVAVFAAVYFQEQLAVAFHWVEALVSQTTGEVTSFMESMKYTLISRASGITASSGQGFIEKATSEVSGWPVEIWYVVLLIAGVGLLLGADHLLRSRRSAAHS
ncbi:MAG: hypothetical protein PHT64_00720 [Bacteroidales bacterium]|nr:hypothetical protein [Bacteroidales bacterium]MDD3521586.1 hypothetical protein [Bacteroidales bacterium]MDD4436209.1 hypothetical protein [Bacteroidales bacterium]MDD5732302.1 hypothetical protein [Bacteroidales bacterium]